MALFKMLHGDSSNISTDVTPFHEGWCYISHDGYFYVDLNVGTEESPNNQRIKLNSKNAETLSGMSLEEIKTSIEYKDLINTPEFLSISVENETLVVGTAVNDQVLNALPVFESGGAY